MHKKITLLPTLLLLILGLLTFLGQSKDPGSNYQPFYFADIILPTPIYTSLCEYDIFSLGCHTGTPNVNTPRYKLKGRELSIPISMSYQHENYISI